MKGSNETESYAIHRRVFLGRLAETLSELIASQSSELFQREGIAIPVKSVSLITVVDRYGPLSAADISSHLDRSHQLVSQKLPKLLKLGLIAHESDPDDARRKLYRLTPEGRDQLARFETKRESLEQVYLKMADELGDANALLTRWIEALKEETLATRVSAQR